MLQSSLLAIAKRVSLLEEIVLLGYTEASVGHFHGQKIQYRLEKC